MKRIFAMLFTLYCVSSALGQKEVYLVWDNHHSSIANAENLLSLHRSVYFFQDDLIKNKYWDEDSWHKKTLGVGYRLSKSIFLDYQLDFLVHITQHEIFGHGFRYREFGYEKNAFNINLPPPYGDGSGFSRRGNLKPGQVLGSHEEVLIRSGGMEAASVLSTGLRRRWLRSGRIHYRESLLFLSTFHDHTFYITSTQLLNRNTYGNDVDNYLRGVNAIYGFNTVESYELTLEDISNRTLVNFLNIHQLFALYAYVVEYVYKGNERFEMPMFKVGMMNWLPSVRFGLTPFGSEIIVENFLTRPDEIIEINMRIGDHKLADSWGGGFYLSRVISESVQIGGSIDLWVQPELQLGGKSLRTTTGGFGGRVIAEANIGLSKNEPIGIFGQIGYKSAGYIQGEEVGEGLILRIGLSMKSADSVARK